MVAIVEPGSPLSPLVFVHSAGGGSHVRRCGDKMYVHYKGGAMPAKLSGQQGHSKAISRWPARSRFLLVDLVGQGDESSGHRKFHPLGRGEIYREYEPRRLLNG